MKRRALLSLALGLVVAACKKDPNDMAIKDVVPRSGAVQIEQEVTITGNFRDDIGYTVYFGPKRASRVSVRDASTLKAICPSGEGPGKVDILIIADNGVTFRIAEGYQYQDAGGGPAAGAEAPRQGGGNLAY